MAETVRVVGCGLRFQPPALAVDYINKVTETIKDLRKRHGQYLGGISDEQLLRLLQKLQVGSQNKPPTPEIDPNEDLNKLDDEELAARKRAMDKDFEASRLRPGDEGFQYNVEKEFAPGVEASGWDENSDSDEQW